MIKLIAYILICLAPTIGQHLISAKKFEPASNLHPQFLEINANLDAALPQEERPEINFHVLEKLEKDNSIPIGAELFRKAVRLIVSLEETVGKCDMESAIILVANYQANVGSEKMEQTRRTQKIYELYRSKYAAECRESFHKRFEELRSGINDIYLYRIALAFRTSTGIKPNHLLDDREPAGYLGGSLRMQSISFASLKGAVDLVVEQIGEQVKNIPDLLDSLKMRYDKDKQKYVKPKFSRKVFRDFLMTPCIKFREQFASVLDPARLDILLLHKQNTKEVEPVKELKSKDPFYFRYMRYNRYCDTLLNDNLYDVFSESWENHVLTKGFGVPKIKDGFNSRSSLGKIPKSS